MPPYSLSLCRHLLSGSAPRQASAFTNAATSGTLNYPVSQRKWMMKVIIVFALCSILLSVMFSARLSAQPTQAEQFAVAPRLCVQHAGTPCVLNLTLSWQLPQTACLYQQHQPDTPLLCAQQLQQHKLSLPLPQDTLLLLKDQASGNTLAQRQLRLLQVDLQSGEHLLNKSRNGWWLLQ